MQTLYVAFYTQEYPDTKHPEFHRESMYISCNFQEVPAGGPLGQWFN